MPADRSQGNAERGQACPEQAGPAVVIHHFLEYSLPGFLFALRDIQIQQMMFFKQSCQVLHEVRYGLAPTVFRKDIHLFHDHALVQDVPVGLVQIARVEGRRLPVIRESDKLLCFRRSFFHSCFVVKAKTVVTVFFMPDSDFIGRKLLKQSSAQNAGNSLLTCKKHPENTEGADILAGRTLGQCTVFF